MMFKTHLALGALISILLLRYFQPEHAFAFSLIFVIAAVLPDIDAVQSTVGRELWPVSQAIALFSNHRGFFHTVWIPAISLIISSYYDYFFIGTAFALGYMLHIVADALSEEGVSLFNPLWKHHFRGFVKTGGKMEYLLLLLACVSLGLVSVQALY